MGVFPGGFLLCSLFSDWPLQSEQPSAALVCFLSSILLPSLGLRIAYLLFMTVKSKKPRWARTVIIGENGAQ